MKGNRGFTLIEVLVTLAIFTAVLAVLVEGLHSGVRTWRSIRTHQVRHAGLKAAAAKMTEDFRHVALAEAAAAIAESAEQTGGERVVFRTTVARRRQRAGRGWVWNEVTYSVEEDEEGGSCLKRTVQARAGKSAVGGKPVEEVVLAGVKSVRFDYLGPDGETAVWTSEDSLPLAVLIAIEPVIGAEISVAAPVPGGWLQRSDIGG